jgi:DNA-binding helix-hairpin-helix protein with protein kinase domain
MGTKIRLDVDALYVQSFATEATPKERGTVRGYACTESTCMQEFCTCTDAYGNCYQTNVNCCDGGGTGTGPITSVRTCCTGPQEFCSGGL